MSTKHETSLRCTAAITCCGVHLPAESEKTSVSFENSSVDRLLVRTAGAVFTVRSSLAPCAVLGLVKVFQR